MTEIETIKDKDRIKIEFMEDNIIISISYPKRSELKTRFDIIDKFKEIMRKV